MGIGKEYRLSRIFGSDGRTFILPVDHGLSLGDVEGLESPLDLVADGGRLGVDAFLAGRFVFEKAGDSLKGRNAPARILTIDGYFGSRDGSHGLFFDLETAVRLGVDAVKVIFYWRADPRERMQNALRVTSVVNASARYDMPVLVEPVLFDDEFGDKDRYAAALSDSARVSLELGADILKVIYPGSDLFSQWCRRFPVPVVILGGAGGGNLEQMIHTIAESLACGGKGIAIGRKIWQRERLSVRAVVKIVMELIHGGVNAEQAVSLLKEQRIISS